MRRIAIIGFSGGSGKTTTCVNLGAALAQMGRRVLLVDADLTASAHLALGLGDPGPSLTQVLMRQSKAKDCVLPARENIDLLPSDLDLAKAQERMAMEVAREDGFLALLPEATDYDYVLLDSAPPFSLLMINALNYADEMLVPLPTEALALTSAQKALGHLELVTSTLGAKATIRWVVPTFYDGRRRMCQAVLDNLQEEFGKQVTSPIRVDAKLAEAPGSGQTIFEYSAGSRGAEDYARLARLVDGKQLPKAERRAFEAEKE
jgi:chromosome partitioning protein